MNYNFIQIKPKGHLLSIIDASNKHRYICFNNKLDALHCVTYVSKFRSDHGYFPVIDFSKPQEKQAIKSKYTKKIDPSEISKFMEIITLNSHDLDYICSMNNVNFFFVSEFSYKYEKNSEIKLLLSAQELNCSLDYYKYIKKLDQLYDEK